MKEKKLTEKQRGHLKLAYEAQQIARPFETRSSFVN